MKGVFGFGFEKRRGAEKESEKKKEKKKHVGIVRGVSASPAKLSMVVEKMIAEASCYQGDEVLPK